MGGEWVGSGASGGWAALLLCPCYAPAMPLPRVPSASGMRWAKLEPLQSRDGSAAQSPAAAAGVLSLACDKVTRAEPVPRLTI